MPMRSAACATAASSGCPRRAATSSRSGSRSRPTAAPGTLTSPQRAIARISSVGEIARFALDTPIARLGRLAIAPDGAAWFADPTGYGMTRLKDGVFTRHQIESARGGPYGVAVTADGAVWATLQNGNQLLRIAADGTSTTFDLPRGGAVPTDVAVGSDGSVWFLQFRANRIGRFKDGQFSDVEVGRENAGLSGIAVAPNGDVWFGMLRRASLGRLRNGHIAIFALPRDNARPFSVAVDRDGNVWYADISGFVGMLPAKPRACAVANAVDLKFPSASWQTPQELQKSRYGFSEMIIRKQKDSAG